MRYICCGIRGCIRCGILGAKYCAPTVGCEWHNVGVYDSRGGGDDFSYFRFQFCFRHPPFLIPTHSSRVSTPRGAALVAMVGHLNGSFTIEQVPQGLDDIHYLCGTRLCDIARCAERYPRKEMSTPAATAEPITPEILLDMQ